MDTGIVLSKIRHYKGTVGPDTCVDTKLLHEAIDLLEQLYYNSCEKQCSTVQKLEKENEELFFTLTGVMHFVDKWLEGEELNQSPVLRAQIMREKLLKLIESNDPNKD